MSRSMHSSSRLKFNILYEDKFVIVIDKPAGLLTTHTQLWGRKAREGQMTAENCLNDYLRKGQAKSRLRVWLVHRLDRDTSGVMMFAKSEEVAEFFRSDWNRLTDKTYIARVEGRIAEDSGVFESSLKEDPDGYKVRSVPESTPGAKKARTEWQVLVRSKKFTLVEVVLKSGRKNQIRVHFSEAGHPVVGDVKYGAAKAPRLFLHAKKLAFVHPESGQKMEFSSNSPFKR
ncbi:MAG: RluA family pseudouridine synthase [Kiritimatiellae bacterium]|nr:RluA family pseudouridine synthase [Kiritimatiellia bacterium]